MMSERVARIFESRDFIVSDNIDMKGGRGTLPSICPLCKGPLDFGPIGGDELICRNQCGHRLVEVLKVAR